MTTQYHTMKTTIEQRLSSAFNPVFLEVQNDSHLHKGPATDSHFKATIVSSSFDGQSLVNRQRSVYRTLNQIMPNIHALQLHTYTLEEWQTRKKQVAQSSACAHAKKV